jgi:hypothetical protein
MPGHVFENDPLCLEVTVTKELAVRDGGFWDVLEKIPIELQKL